MILDSADAYNAYILSRGIIQKAGLIQQALPCLHYEPLGREPARSTMLRCLALAEQAVEESSLLLSKFKESYERIAPVKPKTANESERASGSAEKIRSGNARSNGVGSRPKTISRRWPRGNVRSAHHTGRLTAAAVPRH